MGDQPLLPRRPHLGLPEILDLNSTVSFKILSMDDDYYDDNSDLLADEFKNDHHMGFDDDIDDEKWMKKHGSRTHTDLNGYIRYLMSHSDLHKHLAHVTK